MVSNDHGDHDESQNQEQGEENPAEEDGEVVGKEEVGSEAEDQPKEAKKRKLDGEGPEPDEEAGAEGTASLSCGDDEEVETRENGGASEKVRGQKGQDEPPRKRTKNDAAE